MLAEPAVLGAVAWPLPEGPYSAPRRGRFLTGAVRIHGPGQMRSSEVGMRNEERHEAWDDALRTFQERYEQARSEADATLRQLPESDQVELLRSLDRFEPASTWSFEDGPSIDRLRALAGNLPGEVDRIRREVGRAAGVDVVQAQARQLYPQTVKSEEELEALLEAIRVAADEALGDGKYFQLS